MGDPGGTQLYRYAVPVCPDNVFWTVELVLAVPRENVVVAKKGTKQGEQAQYVSNDYLKVHIVEVVFHGRTANEWSYHLNMASSSMWAARAWSPLAEACPIWSGEVPWLKHNPERVSE